MAPHATTVGVILAGGLARRMGGGDKALRRIGGRTLLALVAERLRPQVATLVLNANGDPSRFSGYGLPVIADSVAGNPGPLGGILAALDWVAAEHPAAGWIATVPCDTPFLPDDLVRRLHSARVTAGATLSIASSHGRAHPVVAVWPVTLRTALRAAVTIDGVRRVERFASGYECVRVAWDEEPDPFININTETELATADRAGRRSGV